MLIFLFMTVSHVYSQELNMEIKEIIYKFINKEDGFKSDLDWCNQKELDSLIFIEPIKSNILNLDIYLFKVKISPSRAYLLINQEEGVLIIGQKGKGMFEELEGLYDFLILSEKEKLDFLKSISHNLYFIYENNLDVKNSNRIKVNGKYLR